MSKKPLSAEQKKVNTDLWIIILITFGAFLAYAMFANQLSAYVKNPDYPVILRLLLNAGVQFAVAGLGITVVYLFRREKLSSYGLVKENALKAILGAIISFLPYLCYLFASGQFAGYQPLSISIAPDVLNSGFPLNILGMALIAIVWGFFEGFNYVVINDKLNILYPSKHQWLDIGAVVCSIVCILFHPFSTSFWGIIEIITTFIAIYGMLLVKKKTNNAWGCVFAFCFIWNAF